MSKEVELGIKIKGDVLKSITFADDTPIICDNLDGLQHLMNRINADANQVHGVQSRPLEGVYRSRYVDMDPDIEIKCRIEAARISFTKMNTLLCNDNLDWLVDEGGGLKKSKFGKITDHHYKMSQNLGYVLCDEKYHSHQLIIKRKTEGRRCIGRR